MVKTIIWTHPDMIGIKFLNLQTKSQNFLKSINRVDTFKLTSYELKEKLIVIELKIFQQFQIQAGRITVI
jgi:hypothetical protein